jgi:hypothetical protein
MFGLASLKVLNNALDFANIILNPLRGEVWMAARNLERKQCAYSPKK